MDEYVDLLDTVTARLDEHTVDTAVASAELPDMVRGYEEVKLRNVERYHERLAELRSRLATDQPG